METSRIAATQGGRLEIASICSFSMKIVSVRSQLWLRTVRSTSSEFPTRLKSGWVFVTSGVFFQCSSWTSNILTHVRSAAASSVKGWFVNGQVWPSPQKPYMNVSKYSTSGLPSSSAASSAVQLAEGVLEERIVVAGLLVERRLALGLAAMALPLALEPHHGDALEDEVRQRRRADVGAAHHHAQSDPLAVLSRGGEGRLPVRFRIEAARFLLQLAPGGADVELLAHRDRGQILDRLLHVHAPEGLRAEVAGHVGDEPHAVARHDLARGSRGHHDFGAGEHFFGRVLGKRPLVQTVRDFGRRAPVVAVPAMCRNECRSGARSGGGACGRRRELEEPAAVHGAGLLRRISSAFST